MDDEVRDYYFPNEDNLDAAVDIAKFYVYPTRTELEEAIRHANHTAKRAPHVLGTATYPSKWDIAHRYVDELLDTIEGR